MLCKEFFLGFFFVSPDVVWNFNPGWSRDHLGLYGFSMYGDQKKIFLKNLDFFFFFRFFFNTQCSKWSRLCRIFTSWIRLVKPLGNGVSRKNSFLISLKVYVWPFLIRADRVYSLLLLTHRSKFLTHSLACNAIFWKGTAFAG